ncbi:FecR family protein [Ochrovirga pacifica]|uniref:FecR family protein n=1 Tax=Ochrovirga pacifica TaxID=1042376 RepID=UPI000255879B|nr:FecR family protein [Ochrovirga pacifica]
MNQKDFLENNDFISYMLSKDANGANYWQSYLDQHPQDQKAFEEAKQIFEKVRFQKAELSNKQRDELYKNVVEGALQKKLRRRKKNRINTGLAIAASILLLILIQFKSGGDAEQTTVLVAQIPSTEKIELISNNKAYILSSNDTLNVTKAGAINLGNTIINNKEITSYNTLKVPFGKKIQLTLVDGTKLWVNAGTVVKFPTNFQKDKRTIYVEGEVYLEVTKDKTRPFVVETSDFKVQVYGTSFDVSAYKNKSTQKVVLIEGAVAVKTHKNELRMQPNEMVTIDDAILTKTHVNVTNHVSWKKGYLSFENKPLGAILTELSRYYNIDFSSTPSDLKENLCTGKIHLSENVTDVLETLSVLSGTTFKIEQK